MSCTQFFFFFCPSFYTPPPPPNPPPLHPTLSFFFCSCQSWLRCALTLGRHTRASCILPFGAAHLTGTPQIPQSDFEHSSTARCSVELTLMTWGWWTVFLLFFFFFTHAASSSPLNHLQAALFLSTSLPTPSLTSVSAALSTLAH